MANSSIKQTAKESLRVPFEWYLIAKFQGQDYPFIKVKIILEDINKGVRVSFIGTRHHYSLHSAKIIKEDEEKYLLNLHNRPIEFLKKYTGGLPVIFTSFDEDKLSSAWDVEKVGVAKTCGLNPNRHIKYYENRVLPLGSMDKYYLGGRKILLKKSKKYPQVKCIFYSIENPRPFVETYYTQTKFDKKFNIELDIQIGKLGFLLK